MRAGSMRGGVVLVVLGLLAVILGGQRAVGQPCEPEWAEGVFGLPGVDGTVRSIVPWDDGTGESLYIGGFFSIAGSMPASNIARWNGTDWSALGQGGPNGAVRAAVVFDDGTGESLYIGGAFRSINGTPIEYVARWDGNSWSAVGDGLSDDVRALHVFDDGSGPALYAGGDFRFSGDQHVGTVARWDGVAWSPLRIDGDQPVQPIFALATYQQQLVVAGSFYWFGSDVYGGIALWDGASWSRLGEGFGPAPSPSVRSLAVADHGEGPVLYAGGRFSNASGEPAANIARWNGEAWSALAEGVDDFAHTLLAVGSPGSQELLVGGEFVRAGAQPRPHLAAWDGEAWTTFGDGSQPELPTFALFQDDRGVHVGGQFRQIGPTGANGIARYQDDRWLPLGRGLGGGGAIDAFEWFDDGGGQALFAAGRFLAAGGERAGHIARWNGSSWSVLAGGLGPADGRVEALVAYNDGTGQALYAGGRFTSAGGQPAAHLARWDGTQWSSVGYPGSLSVTALAVYDGGDGPVLLAGAGSSDVASRVMAWDGTDWTPMGSLRDVAVNDLLQFHDGGGPAVLAAVRGATFPGRVMRFDGTEWSALGGEFNAPVESLTLYDDGNGLALLAGGGFTQVDGAAVHYVAKWDPALASWSQVGSGLDAIDIRVIAVGDAGDGPALYAGGTLRRVGGQVAGGLARLRDGAWEPTRQIQAPRTVLDIISSVDRRSARAVYVGHNWLTTGGVISPFIAKYTCPPAPCPADLDGDGNLTLFDFLAFQNLFDLMDPRADFDGDGSLTLFDFLAFQNAFDAGCP